MTGQDGYVYIYQPSWDCNILPSLYHRDGQQQREGGREEERGKRVMGKLQVN
jgi:hypothetical protein